MKVIESKIEQLRTICANHNVESMYVFGSAAKDELRKDSDIDFLVRFKKIDLSKYFENYIELKSKLKSLFGREVDLVEEQALRNPILIKSIDRNKELIYG